MLKELERYYEQNGILSTAFTCAYKKSCKGDCQSFTGPKSAFVSTRYEKGELPRLLFISLDSGGGNRLSKTRLPAAVRTKLEEECVPSSLPKQKHWYRTHELALYIFRAFQPDMQIDDVNRYFAHTNSAKCCMNKAKSKMADKQLFENCRAYLDGEVQILTPDIVVTQGDEAKKAVEALPVTRTKRLDEFASIIKLNDHDVFWLHTYHPANWGAFNKQRNFDEGKGVALGWLKYSRKIHRFIDKTGLQRRS